MLTLLRNFFTPPRFPEDSDQAQGALTAHGVSVVLLVLTAFSIPFTVLRLQSPIREYALYSAGGGVLIWLFTIYLVQRGRSVAAKFIILAFNTVIFFVFVFLVDRLHGPAIFVTFFLLAIANLLFPKGGVVYYGIVLLVLSGVLYGIAASNRLLPPATSVTNVSVISAYLFTLVSVTVILAVSSANYRRNLSDIRKNADELSARNLELDQLRSSLEGRVAERTRQLEQRANQQDAISYVARSITSIQNLDELLPTIAKLASERFGYYHVGIFLIDDEREFAVLRATNSEGGQVMLNRHHKLRMDVNSIVGYAASRREARIALDVGLDAVYFNNPDLPDTRSEMALPLSVGGRIIGVLDVQSTQPNAFGVGDVAILAILADQIAIAIQNATLFTRAREALRESEETFARYVRQEWEGFASQVKSTGYRFDGTRTTALDSMENQAKAKAIGQTGRLSLEKESTELAVPIRLRGQTVGVLDIKSKKGSRQWTRDEIILLESAAERAALALDNARLVENAQRRAARERAIGEISSKIGAVSDLEAIMQATVEELGRKIGGGTEVLLELEVEDSSNQMGS